MLQQYNIIADRGSESSRIYQSKGLVYRILDGDGNKIGVPIKASLIYSKPTLKNIEAKFESNEIERQRHKQRIMNAIDFSILKNSKQSLAELTKALQKENIQVVWRHNANGIIYGVTYVDHKTKCVFNGSHLGKQHSANAIQQRCGLNQEINQTPLQSKQSFNHEKSAELLHNKQSIPSSISNENADASTFVKSASTLLDNLIQPEENRNANEPFEQKKFKRKRKRKQQQLHN